MPNHSFPPERAIVRRDLAEVETSMIRFQTDAMASVRQAKGTDPGRYYPASTLAIMALKRSGNSSRSPRGDPEVISFES
jgi:hypothetical protein